MTFSQLKRFFIFSFFKPNYHPRCWFKSRETLVYLLQFCCEHNANAGLKGNKWCALISTSIYERVIHQSYASSRGREMGNYEQRKYVCSTINFTIAWEFCTLFISNSYREYEKLVSRDRIMQKLCWSIPWIKNVKVILENLL